MLDVTVAEDLEGQVSFFEAERLRALMDFENGCRGLRFGSH
jgi:hypothetical protein